MRGKRSLFGYQAGLSRVASRTLSDWFDPSSFLIQGQEPLSEEDEEKPHFFLGKLLVVIIAAVLAFRLTTLQITEGHENRYLAEGNRLRQQVTVAPRGSIVDRKGTALVMNEPGYNLEIIPSDLPSKKTERQQVIETIAQNASIPITTLIEALNQVGLSSLDPITIQANIDREKAIVYKLKLANLPGVRVSFLPTRKYDPTLGVAHIIGYTSRMTEKDLQKHPDYHRASPIGRSGIEASYDESLRGTAGLNEVEVNANGQFQRYLSNIPPREGKILHLTLDLGLQKEMVAALQEAMQKNNAKQAAAIAMDARTGGILASVSLPSYDNNIFAKGISNEDFQRLSNNPDKPLLNRTLDGLYPAGSTIKPFVAAAALQEGTIKPNTTLDTSVGVIKIGQWQFPDWKVHGVTEVRQAIAESNDIFFYALGGGWDKIPGLGVERIKKYFHIFGFGEESGADYASEQSGLVPDPEWKKKVKKESWYIGDTYHIAIGQGNLLVTPIQMARALSSIANGGRLVTPHVVASYELPDSSKEEPLAFSEEKLPLSPEILQTVREGMRRTVDSDTGSARSLRNLPFSSAGKTGTAEFGTEDKTHAWYIGYAPYENPEIVIAVIVEGGGEGNAISVPVAGRVFNYYMTNR